MAISAFNWRPMAEQLSPSREQGAIPGPGSGIGRRRYPNVRSAPLGAYRRHPGGPGLGLFQLGGEGEQGALFAEACSEVRAQW